MDYRIILGLLIPLAGTSAGSACVFFMKKDLSSAVQRALSGFAAGVMVAASIWSLIIPAMELSADKGKWAFLPAAIGFWLGVLFLLALDHLIPHLHAYAKEAEGPESHMARNAMMMLAVTLHNIPEGMAAGVVFAGVINGTADMTITAAMVLAIGLAIQNFPEGAIVSMPFYSAGKSKPRAFWDGVLSGAVEPVAAFLTILLVSVVVPAMPYLLGFAAGAMLYVVMEELVPEMASGNHGHEGVLLFAFGFSLMMALDVALG